MRVMLLVTSCTLIVVSLVLLNLAARVERPPKPPLRAPRPIPWSPHLTAWQVVELDRIWREDHAAYCAAWDAYRASAWWRGRRRGVRRLGPTEQGESDV